MQAARPQLRRFGFIGLMLMILGLLVQPAVAAPCEPAEPAAIVADAATLPADPCGDDCEDCALACNHGCCHAHAGALIEGGAAALPTVRFGPAAPWVHALAPPGDGRTGPERPPRA